MSLSWYDKAHLLKGKLLDGQKEDHEKAGFRMVSKKRFVCWKKCCFDAPCYVIQVCLY